MKLLRSGMVIALIMAIHNFPEGIVTFTGAGVMAASLIVINIT